MHFFPSRNITIYMAKLFIIRSFAVLMMLVLILMTLDLLGESGKILSVPGNDQGDVLQYISMRAPQIIARFLPFSVLLGTLITFAGLSQNSEVVAVGMANASPGEGISKNLLKVEENDGKFSDRGIDLYTADFDFVKTMGMTIVTGRDFSRDIISDTTSAVLVNEAMVARMGWKEPLGKKFRFQTGDPKNPTQDKQVVGVVKDYHQNSLYDAIEPLLIIFDKRNNYVFVRTDQGDPKQTLAAIEKTWKQVFPSFPFEYVFLDQDFNSQYKADEKRSQIFTVFSGLTIFIACLGLLGLAAFSTQQRSKEIGIRKVIGAQVQSLFYLVSKEFFLLVTIGIVLAFPVAWYFTNSWLSNFAYRIEIMAEWPTFIASAFLALVITLLTVGFHVIKAATANPVKTLRDE